MQAPNNPAAQQDALEALYQQIIPGVVTVQVTLSQGSALGTGFVYDTQGHIVTNDHVVQGAQNNKVEVDFNSGLKVYGTVVGTDARIQRPSRWGVWKWRAGLRGMALRFRSWSVMSR